MTVSRACARAPVRVDPAGGGTDAPPFVTEHGGFVVNFGVERYAYAAVERLGAGEGVMIYALDLERGVTADSSDQLPDGDPLEFVKAFVRRLVPAGESLVLTTEADVPPGSGLGGSGALGVAVVAALDRAFGQERTANETAALANEIERHDLGYPGGSQDSFGSALGGMNLLEHRHDGSTVPHRLRVPTATRFEIERSSLLIYPGAAHVSGDIHHDIRAAYETEGSATRTAMFQLRESAQRMAKALEGGDIAGYLNELNSSCDSLYRLHSSCDSEAHRELLRGLGDSILGRKTCGAGGGGFLMVHSRPGRRAECIRQAEAGGAMVWPLTIDDRGVVSWDEPPSGPEEIARLRQAVG